MKCVVCGCDITPNDPICFGCYMDRVEQKRVQVRYEKAKLYSQGKIMTLQETLD